MGLASKFMFLVLGFITLLLGLLVTFYLISGKLSPSDLFGKIKITVDMYFWFGVFLLIGITFFAIFLFFKEKFFGST